MILYISKHAVCHAIIMLDKPSELLCPPSSVENGRLLEIGPLLYLQ
jgi:hypothetical protein